MILKLQEHHRCIKSADSWLKKGPARWPTTGFVHQAELDGLFNT
jgi:hypothetical protein